LIKYDEEIFDDNESAVIPVIWWLLHLLGGKIVIPTEPEFWDTNLPEDASVVMYKENDQMILAAERLDNGNHS
jgi:hypothetical protein